MAASVLVQIGFTLLQNDLLHRVSYQVFAKVFLWLLPLYLIRIISNMSLGLFK